MVGNEICGMVLSLRYPWDQVKWVKSFKDPSGHSQNGSSRKNRKIIWLRSSCLFGTEIRQINMLSKRLENRSEEYYIYHKAKVDLIWITGDKIPICFYKTLILEHTTKHCTKLIRNDMAKITMNEEIPQVIRFENHKMLSKINLFIKKYFI